MQATLLLIIAGIAWQPTAQAGEPIDDFIWVLKELDKVKANPFPLSGSAVEEAKGLITCLSEVENDVQTAACLVQFEDTKLAMEIPGAKDIPSWVYDLIHMYIALREEDYWSAVKYVGEAGVCILAQYFTGGEVDVCKLVKELIELAKDVLSAGAAIAEFIADIGEAGWQTLKDVGCALGLGGCGKSTPAHEIVYTYIFAPKVKPDGLAAIEDNDSTKFGKLRALLSAYAKHTPVIWTEPAAQNAFKNHPAFAAAAVETAAKIFDKTVEAQWTAHLGEVVLPELSIQRTQFAAEKINFEAWAAAHQFDQGKGEPGQLVKVNCTKEFAVTREFTHVDRWLAKNPANGIATIIDGRTNADWCMVEFWQKHTAGFAEQFRKFVVSNFKCPESGAGLACPSLASFKKCSGLLASVFQQKQCGINAAKVGPELAAEVQAYFVAHGSLIKCAIVPGSGTNPAALRCTRPTQQYHCNKYYAAHYGPQSPTPLSPTALDCALSINGAYLAKRDQLWKQSVPALESWHPKFKQYPHQPGIDPLMLGVSQDLYTEMKSDATKFGLDAKTVMTWEPSIDGLGTATLASNIGAQISQSLDTVPTSVFAAPTRDGVNPPDPARAGLTVPPVVSAAAVPVRLNVLGAQPRLEAKCVGSRPALFVVITVTNTGEALPAGRVIIAVRESAGRGGGSLPLPAIAKGGTERVLVPFDHMTMTPGARQLMIRLNHTAGGNAPGLSLPAVWNARANAPPNPCASSRSPRSLNQ
jgi:hypothetical protein